MPVNYFVNVRMVTKQNLLEFIKAHPDMPMREILGLFSMKYGNATSTLETYVRELKDANLIVDA